MEDLFRYDIITRRSGGFLSSVRIDDLREFAKRCDQKAKINSANIERWILRYVIEEKEYASRDIEMIKITEV